ncbi:MAG: aminotransferase class I/II-fold pyridoxal phosphate-dependent enzyme [Pseudomonadota bacterium]
MIDPQEALTGRDHGGGLDAAVARWGGSRENWIDLSTGINPNPYPFSMPDSSAWAKLPDGKAYADAEAAARSFWKIPDAAACLLVPGLSVAIAQLPYILEGKYFFIAEPTYNEYRASFEKAGWQFERSAKTELIVSPNNPTGTWNDPKRQKRLDYQIIDESFSDIDPERSHAARSTNSGVLILKGLGKFWGLAGLRFGAVFGDPDIVNVLRQRLGPWAVSGPALDIAKQVLSDPMWAETTRTKLVKVASQLDQIMKPLHQSPPVGTPLFRLYTVIDAKALHLSFAQHSILTRVFPYDHKLLRMGLPANKAEFGKVLKTVASVLK